MGLNLQTANVVIELSHHGNTTPDSAKTQPPIKSQDRLSNHRDSTRDMVYEDTKSEKGQI